MVPSGIDNSPRLLPIYHAQFVVVSMVIKPSE